MGEVYVVGTLPMDLLARLSGWLLYPKAIRERHIINFSVIIITG
jgi:hypothetical protein